MAGLFRHHSSSNNTNESTPNKRFSFSAFCTSPGTLQDVTMDNSYGIGYRSPCVSLQQFQGSTSPAAQGRSVREFEEQMATLRKENFNLKLRLYFIEESIPGYQQANSPDGQETLMKQLIDTKVEIEILRKEIQEKQDILKEAAQAMNQMERIQKETEAKSQAVADELNQKIQYLEMEKEMEKSQNGEFMNELLGRTDLTENINAIQRIRELEGIVKQSEEKINDFQEKLSKLDEILQKRDETIKEYEEKVRELVFQNAELLEALENKDKEVNCAERTFRGLRKSNAELKEENQTLIEALKGTQENFRKEMSNMKTYERQMRDQQEALSKMQVKRLCAQMQAQKLELADKDCMLQEAEERLEKRNQVHEKACRTIQKLMKTVTNLQEENKKIKNKQADEASKEQVNVTSSGLSALGSFGISRSMSDTEATNTLTSGQKTKYEATISEQEELIRSLKSEVKKKTANLQNLVNKELWEKNREIERLMKLINNHKGTGQSPISPPPHNNTASELQQSFSEADFLKALERNKLLQKKVDILIQRLGMDRNNEALILQLQNDVREARNDAEIAEKWRRECVDVCGVLSNRLEELANFLNSLLKHKDVLGMLAADRKKAMRKAINRSLDLSKSLNMTLSLTGDQSLLQISNLSELFGDDVGELENKTFNSHETLQAEVQSMETLKAENKALKQELDHRRSTEAIRKERRSLPLGCMDNQSESEAWSEPDRKVSMARIGLDDHSASIAKSSAAVAIAAKAVDVETDSESDALNRSRSSKTAVPAPTRHIERIAQLEQLIAQRDDRILDIQCQLVDADSRLKKEHLKVIEMTHELEQLRTRNEELNADLLAIGSEHDETLSEHNQSMLQQQIDEKTLILKNIQQERDEIVVKARASEMEILRLQGELTYMANHHESLLQEAKRQELQKLDELKSEYNVVLEARLATQKEQHEQALARDWIARKLYDESQQQMKKLQNQLKEAQSHIEYLQENEEEMKKSLLDSEMAMRAIKKQLDESTMQASKAVLERTRALHEKLELEKSQQELSAQLKQQETECSSMRRQMEKLQLIKSALQQQLDAAQALVHKQQGSDGYTSEDVPLNGAKSASGDNAAAPRRLNNPSPDLGIESDAGRVQSMEVSSAEHKQLKAVELVTSVKQENTDEKSINVQKSHGHHDCAKVDQEVMELQRKLIRTKRSLVETLEQLLVSNQKKAQVEKTIKNQILKTNNVLKNVRSNMENQM